MEARQEKKAMPRTHTRMSKCNAKHIKHIPLGKNANFSITDHQSVQQSALIYTRTWYCIQTAEYLNKQQAINSDNSRYCTVVHTNKETTNNKEADWGSQENKKFGSRFIEFSVERTHSGIRNPSWTSSLVSYYISGIYCSAVLPLSGMIISECSRWLSPKQDRHVQRIFRKYLIVTYVALSDGKHDDMQKKKKKKNNRQTPSLGFFVTGINSVFYSLSPLPSSLNDTRPRGCLSPYRQVAGFTLGVLYGSNERWKIITSKTVL